MVRALSLIYEACKDIIAKVSVVHNKSFMLHIFDELRDELPEFDAYLTREFENKTSQQVEPSNTKVVPLKMLVKELFHPTDEDNQDSTEMLETLARVGIAALIDELEDTKKATYKYLSVSGSNFSYDHCPDDEKKAMIGRYASNDLAESSFAGVTAQIQCYGRIGLCAAAAVSDCNRNGFLHRGTIKKQIKRKSSKNTNKIIRKRSGGCITTCQRSYR